MKYLQVYINIMCVTCVALVSCGSNEKQEYARTRYKRTFWAHECSGNKVHIMDGVIEWPDGSPFLQGDMKQIVLSDTEFGEACKMIQKRFQTELKANKDSLLPYDDYFKQFICYESKGERYVYMHFNAYRVLTYEGLSCFRPDPKHTIYNKDDVKKYYGYVLLNLSKKRIEDFHVN